MAVVNSSTPKTRRKDAEPEHKNSFTIDDIRWEIWVDARTQNQYFYNTVNQKSQWMDPRSIAGTHIPITFSYAHSEKQA